MESDLTTSLKAGRIASESHIASKEADAQTWHEETVTDILLSAVRPYVKYATFNKHHEAQIGADWLWWWIDSVESMAFGMLVQAKRYTRPRQSLELDIRADESRQLRALLVTARELEIAPVYALYLGEVPPEGRAETVSLYPALLARDNSASPKAAAGAAINWSLPLEHLATPAAVPMIVPKVFEGIRDARLRAFLLADQVGAMNVANHVFERVANNRAGQLSSDVATLTEVDAPVVFSDLPDDAGHFGLPYFQHILRGLRTRPPSYVLDFLTDQDLPDEIASRVSGIAVFVVGSTS